MEMGHAFENGSLEERTHRRLEEVDQTHISDEEKGKRQAKCGERTDRASFFVHRDSMDCCAKIHA